MKKRLTELQFEDAIKGLDAGCQTIEIARGVLVHGESQTSYAKKFGLTRGAVSQAVERVYSRAKTLPDGYEKITAILPAHKAFVVRKWEEESKKDLENK